jgi:hypothetical protein
MCSSSNPLEHWWRQDRPGEIRKDRATLHRKRDCSLSHLTLSSTDRMSTPRYYCERPQGGHGDLAGSCLGDPYAPCPSAGRPPSRDHRHVMRVHPDGNEHSGQEVRCAEYERNKRHGHSVDNGADEERGQKTNGTLENHKFRKRSQPTGIQELSARARGMQERLTENMTLFQGESQE